MVFTPNKLHCNLPSEGFGFSAFLNGDDDNIEQVEEAMKQMDKKFNTQFYVWIRNENNVDYISYYLRRVISEYEKDNFIAIRRAIKWLVKGWSVQRTAELLIKLFYHWGIGDIKFAALVISIIQTWTIQPGVVDLVVTLVIGERSSKTAKFIYQLTKDWSSVRIVELVSSVASRLRWTERYFKHFLLQLACLGERGWDTKRTMVTGIRQSFNARKLLMQHVSSIDCESSSKPLAQKFNPAQESLELIEFGSKLLTKILDFDTAKASPKPSLEKSPKPSLATKSPTLSRATLRLQGFRPSPIPSTQSLPTRPSPTISQTSSPKASALV